jgi:SsrA-binding protein
MSDIKLLISNKKATYDFFIRDTYEAGISLLGTEVKSLRGGRANLQDAFCRIKDGEIWLQQAHISPYEMENHFNHEPLRPRKLLLKKTEIRKISKAVEQKGNTLIPLRWYLKGRQIKLEIGVATGKKLHDKRDSIADKDAKRQLERIKKGDKE